MSRVYAQADGGGTHDVVQERVVGGDERRRVACRRGDGHRGQRVRRRQDEVEPLAPPRFVPRGPVRLALNDELTFL